MRVIASRPARQSQREQRDAEASAERDPDSGDVRAQQQCDDDPRIDQQREPGTDLGDGGESEEFLQHVGTGLVHKLGTTSSPGG